MKKIIATGIAVSVLSSALFSTTAMAQQTSPHFARKDAGTVTIHFGSYSITKDVYEKGIFPAFQKYWKDKTGQTVVFQDSYDGSGAESRAIANGLPVDVAALSLADDINRIQKSGFITHNWQSDTYHGMATDSIVAIGVRKGNPKAIKNWTDLSKDLVVDIPNPQTSGGAKWDINALYGAGLYTNKGNTAKTAQFLGSILRNVSVWDKSGEASMTTFTRGLGDAIVTYESDILQNSNHLKTFDEVVPSTTILVENPVAVIDKNVDAHGNRTAVQGFVDFLRGPQAQQIFADAGYRPVNPQVSKQYKNKFPHPTHLFTINYLGGWDKVNQLLYSQNGLVNQLIEEGK